MPRLRTESASLRGVPARRFGPLTFRRLSRRAGGALTILHITLPPRAKAPALYHARTHEFFYVLRGGGGGRIGGRRRSLRPGDAVFMPAGTPHEFFAGSAGLELLDVFTPAFDMRRPDIVPCPAPRRARRAPRRS